MWPRRPGKEVVQKKVDTPSQHSKGGQMKGRRQWFAVALLTCSTLCVNVLHAATAPGPGDAVVNAQPVPGDVYPERRHEFAGGVVGLADVVYETLPGFRPLRLDLYLPPASKTRGPSAFVVYVHGGGWVTGHTRQSGAFANWPDVLASLAARGYVVASIEYRLSGEAKSPAAIQDVKAALRWLRTHADAYGIDKRRAVIWGASAGGQLAGLAATSCGVAELEPVAPAPPLAEPPRVAPPLTSSAALESDCVQAAITWYGIFDFKQLVAQASAGATNFPGRPDSADSRYLGCPATTCTNGAAEAASAVTYIDAKDPPMLLMHGSVDKTVPVKQSQEMYEKLKAAGVPAELVIVPDVDHSFIGATPEKTRAASREALAKVFAFIDATVGPGAAHASP
jgi:acetyl esterase/lipase